jgi:hypothetical protein
MHSIHFLIFLLKNKLVIIKTFKNKNNKIYFIQAITKNELNLGKIDKNIFVSFY